MQSFSFFRSGLCVMKDKPYIGASPDGFLHCTCCPDAVIEIKCPYSIRLEEIESGCRKKYFFLDGNKKLKKGHNYYYQAQGLMMVTGRKRCIFIVYTLKDIYSQIIEYDESFVNTIEAKLESFFTNNIFPRLKD